MPIDPNMTKNGVDLNEIDVSLLTLVDKETLLADMSKRLAYDIRTTFDAAMAEATHELKHTVSDAAAASNKNRGSGGTDSFSSDDDDDDDDSLDQPSRGRVRGRGGNKNSSNDSQDNTTQEFEKLRKLQHKTGETIDKLNTLQRKKDRTSNEEKLKGKVYSDTGKKASESLNDIAGNMHNYSGDKLEAARARLSNIQEAVRFGTVNEENKLLTNATTNLQEALQKEISARATTMGKIGQFMTSQNIDAVSIITGFASRSPVMGLLTKFAFDAVKDYRDKKRKAKNAPLAVGDIKDILPRGDAPEIDDGDRSIDSDTLLKLLGKQDDPDVRHAALENLLQKGKISPDQHADLSAELLPPEFVPLWERMNPTPGNSERTGSSQAQPLRDHTGQPIRDYAGYQKTTTLKIQDGDTQEGWRNYIERAGLHKMHQEHEDKLKTPRPDDWDDELFGDYHAKPSALSSFERLAATRAETPYVNPLQYLMDDGSSSPTIISNESPSTSPTVGPVRGIEENTASPSLLNLSDRMNGQSSNDDDPLSRIERLNQEQVEELKKIEGRLQKQIEQADLDSDAKLRERQDAGTGSNRGLDADMAGTRSPQKSGSGGPMKWLETLSHIRNIRPLQALRSIAGAFKGGIGKIGGVIRGAGGLFGGAAGATLGGAAGTTLGGAAATGAVGAGAAATGAVGAGAAATGLGRAGGFLGKMGGVGKLLGKVGMFVKGVPVIGWILTGVMALLDFIPAFINAEEMLGMGKGQKANFGDRVTAGFGGVIKGLFGIFDFISSLLGYETDLGGFLGKGFTDFIQKIRGRSGGSPPASIGTGASRGVGAPTTATAGATHQGIGRGGTPTPSAADGASSGQIPMSGVVSSLFGKRRNPHTGKGEQDHGGIDVGGAVGTPIYSVAPGKVVRANGTDDPGGYGNVVDIMHADGHMSRYAHLSKINVGVGQEIKKGDFIGASGGSKGAEGAGNSEHPHLHFEISKNGQKVDPQTYLGRTLKKGDNLNAGASPNKEARDADLWDYDDVSPKKERAGSGGGGLTLDDAFDVSPQKERAGGTAMVDTAAMAKHIAQFEGWNETGKNKNWSQLNNNPGNIRPIGDQKSNGGFRVFDTPEEGWSALHKQIEATTAKGLNVKEFFGGKEGVYKGYAPANENKPHVYAEYVAKQLGIDPNAVLSLRPQQENSTLSTLPGMKLAQASTAQTNLNRSTMSAQQAGSNIVVAPQTKTVNNNSSTNVQLGARNTDNTYQRIMNGQFAPT